MAIIHVMKILLGSKSKDKKQILIKAFEELHVFPKVESVEVDSEITNQPLDKNITLKGAKNRARNAKKKRPDADFWVGLEGGLHPTPHEASLGRSDYLYHLVTYACLIDKDGDEFIGNGTEIHLPESVSDEVKTGGWFGDVIRIYAKDHKIDENLITRETPFIESIQNAYANYLVARKLTKYRNKINAVITNKEGEFLLVQLNAYDENQWNTPGGGIKNGETPEDALSRELKEELGITKFEIIEKSKITDKYDFPDSLLVKWLKKGEIKYKGQIQTQFIVKFTGKKEDIKTQEDEIRQHKWVKYEDLESHLIFPNQWENIKKVIQASKKIGRTQNF